MSKSCTVPSRIFAQVQNSAIDCTFFIAAVDLWSDNGLTNMNMVLSPATSDKPHRGTPRKRQHSGTITTDTIMSHSSPTDPETPRAVPRNLPWSYTGRNLAPESEVCSLEGDARYMAHYDDNIADFNRDRNIKPSPSRIRRQNLLLSTSATFKPFPPFVVSPTS